MENPALIFIPDISGFTEFITQTEIKHSNHIISELIEIILSANRLNLTVSEIEGDAVLFYRKGEPPTLRQLIEQIKNIPAIFRKTDMKSLLVIILVTQYLF